MNVHPSKTEVRFRHSSFVHDLTRDAIRQALIAARPVAAFPVRRNMGDAPIEDVEAIERLAEESSVGSPSTEFGPHRPGSARGLPQTSERPHERLRDAASADSRLPYSPTDAAAASSVAPPPSDRNGSQHGDLTLSAPKPVPVTGDLPLGAASSPTWVRSQMPKAASGFTNPIGAGELVETGASFGTRSCSCEPSDAAVFTGIAQMSDQTDHPGAHISQPEFPADLRPLGQVEQSYIVATNAAGLWIVDQHAAHERVLFEKHLRQVRSQEVEAQRLLLPTIIEIKPQQQAVFQDIADELVTNGFDVEPFGQRTIAVKTAPAELAAGDVEFLLLEILDGVGQDARGLTLDVLRGRISASLACRAAIKIHMGLDRAKMEWLLAELAQAESPMSCPHGRPVMLRYTIKELERAFHRT